jgi:phosphate transport system protein
MQKHFSQELETLKNNIHQMADLVGHQLDLAMTALKTGDLEICRSVKDRDREVDAYEVLIQAQCENLFALFQPVAVDLRFIMTAMMISYQLERCGDIAVNITNRVKKTVDYKSLIEECQIMEMSAQAQTMAQEAIASFLHNNVERAKKVLEMDEVVDRYNKQIFQFLVERMQSQPESVEPGAHLIVLSRQIERLADHATNIAEDVVFLVDAQIIAHMKKLQPKP